MVELHTLVEDKDSSVLSVNQTMNAFELTMTQGFHSLKVRQTEIAIRVRTCTDVYGRLKKSEARSERPEVSRVHRTDSRVQRRQAQLCVYD